MALFKPPSRRKSHPTAWTGSSIFYLGNEDQMVQPISVVKIGVTAYNFQVCRVINVAVISFHVYGSDSVNLVSQLQSFAARQRGYKYIMFRLSNILAKPFDLATLSVSILCWVVTAVSCILCQIQADTVNLFPSFAWWSIVYSFFLIAGIFYLTGSDGLARYQVAIAGYLGAGIVLVTSSVNSLAYSPSGARVAATVGFIVLSMVMIIWLLYFGSEQSSKPRQLVDSLSDISSSIRTEKRAEPLPSSPKTHQEWPYTATALYSYDGNPKDPKEISFTRGEILDVSNICGAWWPVKKTSGEEGIAPSSYLVLR
ncbi:Osmosensor, Mos1 [Pochonia chlamydosporia 170]|uniref:Osmosensor, Mos1 n=1 Tax=Pochonia chlamydosporia 170 TaxID=1380566 RepID=A0A179EWZ9_METCM|nr:Osmosensor, Mos1 [Pochonia chlamydosporia 170]OAQ57691.2 Osmosensor, Mos1 [Pochonia chlamydosporia 170]